MCVTRNTHVPDNSTTCATVHPGTTYISYIRLIIHDIHTLHTVHARLHDIHSEVPGVPGYMYHQFILWPAACVMCGLWCSHTVIDYYDDMSCCVLLEVVPSYRVVTMRYFREKRLNQHCITTVLY